MNITTEAHFVPMKVNMSQIEDTIELCVKLNISRISFLRLVNHGRASLNKSKIFMTEGKTQELKKLLKKLKEERKDIDIRMGIPLSGHEYKHKCAAAGEKLNIKYDGYVYPCEVFKNDKIKFINSHKPDSIFEKDITDIYINSEYLNQVRKTVKQFSNIHDCENCVGQYYIETIK